MEDWDNDVEHETLYDGNFFPSSLVLEPSELAFLHAKEEDEGEEDDTEVSDMHLLEGTTNDINEAVIGDFRRTNSSEAFYGNSYQPAKIATSSGAPENRGKKNDSSSKTDARSNAKKNVQVKVEHQSQYQHIFRSSSENSSSTGRSRVKETPEETARRREIVAAASRVTRQKRKREREELKKRNEQLEKDRDIYLMRIAELQTEVQALRNSGAINLSKENELLRVEIRKHKAFIRSIVDVTKSVPDLTSEEKFRLACSGCDSAHGQIAGLAHTSVVDNSWHWTYYNALNHLDTRSPAHFGVQILPRGCEMHAMKRINARIDLPWRPESMENLQRRIWKAWTAPDIYNRTYTGSWTDNAEVNIAEIPTSFREFQNFDDADLRVFQYSEDFGLLGETDEEKIFRKCIFITTWKYTKLVSASTFPENPKIRETCKVGSQPDPVEFPPQLGLLEGESDDVSKDDPDACIIMCCTSTIDTAVFASDREGMNALSEILPFIEGIIIRPGPKGQGCLMSIVWSVPIRDIGFAGFSSKNNLINQDFSCGTSFDGLVTSIVSTINNIELDEGDQAG